MFFLSRLDTIRSIRAFTKLPVVRNLNQFLG